MATRKNLSHIERTREKIRGSQLINRLIDNSLGKIELNQGQIRSIEILLKKAYPDMKAVEQTLEVEGNISFGWHDPHTVQSENTPGSTTSESE